VFGVDGRLILDSFFCINTEPGFGVYVGSKSWRAGAAVRAGDCSLLDLG
jgi:hypothetical protein